MNKEINIEQQFNIIKNEEKRINLPFCSEMFMGV